MTKQVETGKGIASFVLAIIGLIFFWFPYLAIVPSILSIIYAVKQRKIKPTGLATAGLIIGIIATSICGFMLVIMTITLISLKNAIFSLILAFV